MITSVDSVVGSQVPRIDQQRQHVARKPVKCPAPEKCERLLDSRHKPVLMPLRSLLHLVGVRKLLLLLLWSVVLPCRQLLLRQARRSTLFCRGLEPRRRGVAL